VWLWGIVDEFIYQFMAFQQSKLKTKSDAEKAIFKDTEQVGLFFSHV